MTGSEGDSGRLVIRFHDGESLVSPEDWPPRWSAKPGMTLATFWERHIVGDPFLQQVMFRLSRGPVSPLDGKRPVDLNLAWWEETWPDRVFSPFDNLFENRSPSPNYHRDRVYWRLVVEFVSRWEAGDLILKARVMDKADPPEVVEPRWLKNPHMTLFPRARGGGWFCPEKWQGREPPPTLPSYYELTVWPAAKTKPKTKPKMKTKLELLTDALVSLHTGSVFNLHSRAVPVAILHEKAGEKAGVRIANSTFEKALKRARARLSDA